MGSSEYRIRGALEVRDGEQSIFSKVRFTVETEGRWYRSGCKESEPVHRESSRYFRCGGLWIVKCVTRIVLGIALAACAYAQPTIKAGGVTNAASYISPDLPNGPLARGGFFV